MFSSFYCQIGEGHEKVPEYSVLILYYIYITQAYFLFINCRLVRAHVALHTYAQKFDALSIGGTTKVASVSRYFQNCRHYLKASAFSLKNRQQKKLNYLMRNNYIYIYIAFASVSYRIIVLCVFTYKKTYVFPYYI